MGATDPALVVTASDLTKSLKSTWTPTLERPLLPLDGPDSSEAFTPPKGPWFKSTGPTSLPGAPQLFSWFPASERAVHKILRQLGHTNFAAGSLTPATVDWIVALQRHTDTMSNEYTLMAAMGSFRGGFDPSLTIGQETLGAIHSPTHFLWGENDVYGDELVARTVVDAMPNASTR